MKKQELKDVFTLRIYQQEDKDTLDKAYERTKQGFDTISDFIRYCTITGAEKLLGDSEVDQRLNLTEIKNYLKEIVNKLDNMQGEMKVNHKENLVDSRMIQNIVNYISYIVCNSDCNKLSSVDTKDGLFYLPLQRTQATKELDGNNT